MAIGLQVADTAAMSQSVESLAQRYHKELLRVLRSQLGNEEDAADLAQEAYVRVLRYEGQCSAEGLRRMLFRIASNLLADHWRWRRLRRAGTHLPIADLELESGEPSQERQLASAMLLERLEDIILAMPEKRRAAFLLSRIHGLRNAEIAERCGVSVKMVEKHIASALAEIRTRVGDTDVQSL